MKMIFTSIFTGLLLGATTITQAAPIDDLLKRYQAQAQTPFNADTGKALFTKSFIDAKSAEKRSCTTCHTYNLRTYGKHVTTGKSIDPLAPSANSKRLADIKKIEKWLLRNCKWTLGRECTTQEKGDYLTYIKSN